MLDFDISSLPTPCYVVDERLLKKNLGRLKEVEERTGCHILLAQKAFSMYETYPLIKQYISGTTASSLFEAKLGATKMGGEVHIFSPAYKPEEMEEILTLCDHVIFNSLSQWNRYKSQVMEMKKKKTLECGLRINPEYSEIDVDMYNPCFPKSRFGITLEQLQDADLGGIDGLHFHTMCEQNSDVLSRTLEVVTAKFEPFLTQVKWVNFGGGHHITREDYDVELLIRCINEFKETYHTQVYLEPGEAIALNAGYLVSEVVDLTYNQGDLAIMDVSAACHMPDVLEMPYRPYILESKNPLELEQVDSESTTTNWYTYRLGGPTCLSGDVIGDYAFDHRLEIGERLVFTDMAIYSMVKNNTFNGINLPAIAIYSEKNGLNVLKTFGYEDFVRRL